jgi:hypothetical protein
MGIRVAPSREESLSAQTLESVGRLKEIASAFEKSRIRPLWESTSDSSFGIHAVEESMFGPENIVGVGIGEKSSGGITTGELCIKVFTEVKAHPDWVSEECIVPDIWEGSRIDVEAIGPVEAFGMSPGFNAPNGYLNPRQRFRSPLFGGVSIGQYPLVTAGTLGCLCTSAELNEPVLMLSNNHVLAATNNAKNGDLIIQPARYDNGKPPGDTVAQLFDFVPIAFEGKDNYVDAALAKPDKKIKLSPEIQGIGKIREVVGGVEVNTRVKKMGRTTHLTLGTTKSVGGTYRVSYGPAGKAILKDQILITGSNSTPFSAGGDSGSLVLDQRNRALGLLFAGTPSHSIANPIITVLSKFSEFGKKIKHLEIITSMDDE